MTAPTGRVIAVRWAVAAVFAATTTVLSGAPITFGTAPEREVEQISVQLEAEPETNSCAVLCGVQWHRTACEPEATPVCQCEYAPYARCRQPPKRKPPSR